MENNSTKITARDPVSPLVAEKERKKGGRPKLKCCEKDVYDLALVGCTQQEIALIVGASLQTINVRFSETIEKAYSHLRQALRHKQIQLAMSGNVSLLIWLGKQWLGQKEPTQKLEYAGDIPIVVKHFGKEEATKWKEKASDELQKLQE